MPLCAPVPGLTSRAHSELSPATGSSSHSMSTKSPGCPPRSVTLGALSLPTPCPPASAGWAVLCLGTDSNSHGFCGKAHSSLGYPPPCPGRRALGQSPFHLEGWPGWPEEEAGDCLCILCSHSLDCDSTGSRVPREQSEPGGPTAGETAAAGSPGPECRVSWRCP